MRPITTPSYVTTHYHDKNYFLEHIDEIRKGIQSLIKGDQIDVSVVIPAYNEEEKILRTLASLSKTQTNLSVEILIVNNNSFDKTKELAERGGANVITETKQGVQNARTAGLHAAKGKLIINADADTIYTPYWVELMTSPLKDENISMAYGKFAFFPESGAPRLLYFLYETSSDPYKWWLAKTKEEAMFVYGCSSCYRKEQAIAVNGFEHPPGTNEDGYLGYKLRTKFGKLQKVTSNKALAWTSDRRLIEGGGVFASFTRRFRKALTQKIDTSNLEKSQS
ncbi:glycosyltransferase [Pinibacter soli]|uniref:Glycosyltransferase family 2 protein n=1 Tax=Pinibacter soli TaxID=3044211 RepID=A0ABT6RIH7_9BACT|nr:glycosyltransferase family 2 protein [Pinibacter soli]MDI3322276.1 glycosyltransferase family 2 protein [Pinibacter soli]